MWSKFKSLLSSFVKPEHKPTKRGAPSKQPKPSLAAICSPKSQLLTGQGTAEGKIKITGAGNVVDIQECRLFKREITVSGNNNRVLIGKDCQIRGRIVVKGNGQLVSIGDHTTFQSAYILCAEGCNVYIGRWCMFSRSIEIRTTDAHSVVSVETGKRLNLPSSVEISDHVWIGVGALISKGARIPEDCIVGAKAFVNSAFTEPNTVIAGSPATVVKRGTTWHRSCKSSFTEEEISAWRIIEEPRF